MSHLLKCLHMQIAKSQLRVTLSLFLKARRILFTVDKQYISVDIAVDSRSIVGRQSVDSRSIVGR